MPLVSLRYPRLFALDVPVKGHSFYVFGEDLVRISFFEVPVVSANNGQEDWIGLMSVI